MNIMRYLSSIFCKLGISAIAAAALWLQFDQFGLDAWRLLETWMLALATVYYLGAIIKSWFSRKSGQKLTFCPFIQGTILLFGGCLIVFWLVCQAGYLVWPGADFEVAFLALIVVPLLALIDWLLFSQKGEWRSSYPWQWLGLIISFCCVLILTAGFLPRNSIWKYPYEFLDYNVIGIITVLWFTALIAVIVLIIGYTLLTIDYVLSGEFSRHVVVPRIKTVVVEEEEPEPAKPNKNDKAKQNASKIRVTQPTAPIKPTSSSKSSKPVEPAKSIKPNVSKTVSVKVTSVSEKPKTTKVDSKSAHKFHSSTTKTMPKSRTEIIANIKQQVGKGDNAQYRKVKK